MQRPLPNRGSMSMNKDQLDRLLDAMVSSNEGVSDLLFVAGRPMQVEILGTLKPFVFDASEAALTSERIEAMARVIIDQNPRLLRDLEENGSCDCGYTLKNSCRFRVNVFMQTAITPW
jgi:twitching motility protein PilT